MPTLALLALGMLKLTSRMLAVLGVLGRGASVACGGQRQQRQQQRAAAGCSRWAGRVVVLYGIQPLLNKRKVLN